MGKRLDWITPRLLAGYDSLVVSVEVAPIGGAPNESLHSSYGRQLL